MISSVGSSNAYAAGYADTPIAVLQLDPYPVGAFQLTARLSVNGHEALFLLDTGGGVSLITPQFAGVVGCKPWGRVTVFRLTGERIDMPRCDNMNFAIAGQQYANPIVGVFDVTKMFPAGAPKLDGLLALNVFAKQALTLSVSGRLLMIESADSLSARIGSAKEIPIRLVRQAEGVGLMVDAAVPTRDGTAWMEIDSGNAGPPIVGEHVAGALGLDPGGAKDQPAGFSIGGFAPVHGKVTIADMLIMDGNIGAEFLARWDIILDLAGERAWLSPAATPQ